MAIGGILIGVFMGSIVSVISLCFGASVMIAFSLYVGIGVTSLLLMMVLALRTEDSEVNTMMELDTKAIALH